MRAHSHRHRLTRSHSISWLWKDVKGVLLFYSATDRKSFSMLQDWRYELRRFCDAAPVFLVASKYDCSAGEIKVPKDEGVAFSKMNDMNFFDINPTVEFRPP